jgi:hypothetical protein
VKPDPLFDALLLERVQGMKDVLVLVEAELVQWRTPADDPEEEWFRAGGRAALVAIGKTVASVIAKVGEPE